MDIDLSFHAAMTQICKGVMDTVADCPGDSPERRAVRQQTVADTMMSLMPLSPIEAILAGHCVIFDHLLNDGARDLLRGQAEAIKLRARPQICATARQFLAQLEKFERLQARSAGKIVADTTAQVQTTASTTADPRVCPPASVQPEPALPEPTQPQPAQPEPAQPAAIELVPGATPRVEASGGQRMAERELGRALARRGQPATVADNAPIATGTPIATGRFSQCDDVLERALRMAKGHGAPVIPADSGSPVQTERVKDLV